MAITQEVNIEMLEKLPDGNFKIKYPKTKIEQVIGEINAVKLGGKTPDKFTQGVSIKTGTISDGGIIPKTSGFNNYIYFVSMNSYPIIMVADFFIIQTSCGVVQSTRQVTSKYWVSNSMLEKAGVANYLEVAWN